MVDRLVDEQFELLKIGSFTEGSDICRYFELLPEASHLRQGYDLMLEYPNNVDKLIFQDICGNR